MKKGKAECECCNDAVKEIQNMIAETKRWMHTKHGFDIDKLYEEERGAIRIKTLEEVLSRIKA